MFNKNNTVGAIENIQNLNQRVVVLEDQYDYAGIDIAQPQKMFES